MQRSYLIFKNPPKLFFFKEKKKERRKKGKEERKEKGREERRGEGKREGRRKRGRKKEKPMGYINKTEVKIFMKYIFYPCLLNFHMSPPQSDILLEKLVGCFFTLTQTQFLGSYEGSSSPEVTCPNQGTETHE